MTGLDVSSERSAGADDFAALVDAVRTALQETGRGWLRRIVVSVEAEAIVLRGTVPSFYLKQMAQTIAMGVSGSAVMRNELLVDGGNP
jgi:osmotically-inducible protein OsmY